MGKTTPTHTLRLRRREATHVVLVPYLEYLGVSGQHQPLTVLEGEGVDGGGVEVIFDLVRARGAQVVQQHLRQRQTADQRMQWTSGRGQSGA